MENMEEFNAWMKDYQAMLKDGHKRSQEALEKQLTYLAGGSLVISIAFIKDIVGNISSTEWRFFLITSWVLLVLTLIINFISHFLASQAYTKAISDFHSGHLHGHDRFKYVKTCNYISMGSVLLGIVCLVAFVIKNL